MTDIELSVGHSLSVMIRCIGTVGRVIGKSMKGVAVLALCTWILTGCATGQLYIGEVPREPLDRLWENHMLEGTRAGYIEGRRDDGEPIISPKAVPGSPLAV